MKTKKTSNKLPAIQWHEGYVLYYAEFTIDGHEFRVTMNRFLSYGENLDIDFYTKECGHAPYYVRWKGSVYKTIEHAKKRVAALVNEYLREMKER